MTQPSATLAQLDTENPPRAKYARELMTETAGYPANVRGAWIACYLVRGILRHVDAEYVILTETFGIPTADDLAHAQEMYGPSRQPVELTPPAPEPEHDEYGNAPDSPNYIGAPEPDPEPAPFLRYHSTPDLHSGRHVVIVEADTLTEARAYALSLCRTDQHPGPMIVDAERRAVVPIAGRGPHWHFTIRQATSDELDAIECPDPFAQDEPQDWRLTAADMLPDSDPCPDCGHDADDHDRRSTAAPCAVCETRAQPGPCSTAALTRCSDCGAMSADPCPYEATTCSDCSAHRAIEARATEQPPAEWCPAHGPYIPTDDPDSDACGWSDADTDELRDAMSAARAAEADRLQLLRVTGDAHRRHLYDTWDRCVSTDCMTEARWQDILGARSTLAGSSYGATGAQRRREAADVWAGIVAARHNEAHQPERHGSHEPRDYEAHDAHEERERVTYRGPAPDPAGWPALPPAYAAGLAALPDAIRAGRLDR